jgi:hypothetical protein
MTDPAELQVRGGPGGVSAHLEDLERAGRLLRDIAEELAVQGRAVLGVALDPGLQVTAALAPVTFARAEAALTTTALGPAGLLSLAARAELLGSGVLGVADGYRTADAVAAASLRTTATLVGQVVGRTAGALAPGLLVATVVVVVGLGAASGTDRTGRARLGPLRTLGGLTLRLLADHAALTEAVIPVLPGVIGGLSATVPGAGPIVAWGFGSPLGPTTVAEVAGGVGALGGLAGVATGGRPWFRESNDVQVRVTPAVQRPPLTGTADVLGRIPVTPTGRPQIHVERVDTPAGRAWVVAVPGTADWSPAAGPTPFDLTGDVRLMAGQRSAGMTGVVEAMRAVGVRRGEPVLLAGHSQGGLIAAAVAADPVVRREFSVSHVLTSGAPVASIPVPDEVQVLSIEHSDDLVPRLDGAVNDDRANWVTVTAPAPTAELPPADRAEPLLAHRAGLYRSTAERVDLSDDPSIARWRSGLTPFLDAPGGSRQPGSGASWDVDVSRVGTG